MTFNTFHRIYKATCFTAEGDVYGNVFVAVSLKLAHCYLEKEDWENAIMGYHYCIAAQVGTSSRALTQHTESLLLLRSDALF